ncbi:unnamed protein product [Rotaria sordida]|uniref:Transmembrane protein 192 n=1 Tax=Rotaria sordida TaxID=392033 RepID=A0A813Z7C5_9BILA|nr:unnamed protein product [Rotaria sordida]CAF0938386.1 unnamed protein product [Rotaria sordida]CAF1075023.1 unnamed protein product [Rotaria sordida]CAF1079716.1 unnamed protein product [Rotaria sordida]CAF3740528.1 unnamed protein product [Rotaria sordida]
MVSLNPQHSRSGGAMSFEDRSIHINDEIITENTPLIMGIEKHYRPIRTTTFIIIHILLVILFEIVIVLFPFLCYDKRIADICDRHSPYNISLYVHAGFYVVCVIFDRMYHYHQDLSQRDGYLDFYRQTINLRRIPLIIISTGNAILVAMIKLLEDYPSSILPLQPWHCLAILTTIEIIIMLSALLWYLVLTIKFNKQHVPPDAALDDLLSTFASLQTSTNEIGFRDETYTENVLEKQADLIRYLRERNDHLARLLQQSKQQLNTQQTLTNIT